MGGNLVKLQKGKIGLDVFIVHTSLKTSISNVRQISWYEKIERHEKTDAPRIVT